MKKHFETRKGRRALEVLEWNEPCPLGIEVRIIRRRRSTDQNARYWSIVSALANHIGDTREGVHEDLLMMYHGADTVQGVNGLKMVPRGRSSKLDAQDFSALMQIAEKAAADLNVQWDREAG